MVSFCETLAALGWLFASPSEPGQGRLFGYSAIRLALAALLVAAALAMGWLGWRSLFHPAWLDAALRRLEAFFARGDRLFFTVWILAGGACLAAGMFLFTWLLFPPALRPLAAWISLLLAQTCGLLALGYRALYWRKEFNTRFTLFPSWKNLDRSARRTFLLLALIGLIYFAAFVPANLKGAENAHAFQMAGGDEVVIYPILTNMLTPGKDFSATLYHIFIYEDYHYGFPFYALSALVILPVRLAAGGSFADLTQVNLLILRQFVSVLPLILAALILVYLADRFRSWWRSAGLFLLILSIPGVVENNLRFWHPDALNLLFIALTFFFLDRDRFHFGRDFLLAAVFCGLSAATRLYGFFFFLAVGGYLLVGLARRRLTLRRAILQGALFILFLAGVVLLTSPFLLSSSARANFTRILNEKSTEMTYGYADKPDPLHQYRTGWDAWTPFFEKEFSRNFFSLFLVASALAASFFGEKRLFFALLLAWVVVIGGYLVYFVAVKSTQYMLPLFVPLYSSAFALPEVVSKLKGSLAARGMAWGIMATFILLQFAFNLYGVFSVV